MHRDSILVFLHNWQKPVFPSIKRFHHHHHAEVLRQHELGGGRQRGGLPDPGVGRAGLRGEGRAGGGHLRPGQTDQGSFLNSCCQSPIVLLLWHCICSCLSIFFLRKVSQFLIQIHLILLLNPVDEEGKGKKKKLTSDLRANTHLCTHEEIRNSCVTDPGDSKMKEKKKKRDEGHS